MLAAVVGLITIDAGFVFDDPHAILGNPVVTGEVPWWEAIQRDFWGRPIDGGINTWRPIMPMVWAALWRLSPNSPLPFHLVSILLHILATALATQLARTLRPPETWAITVGSLFAVHPLNAEAVGAIVAQADLLSFALVLSACLVALRPATPARGLACAAVFAIAMMVKEASVVLAPLIVILIAMQSGSRKARWVASLPSIAVALAMIGFQVLLPRRETMAMWGNTLAHQAEGLDRLWLGLYSVGRCLVMSFWPHPLAPSHGYAAIELHASVLWPFAVVGAVLLVVGAVAGVSSIRHRRTDWVVALSFLYAPALLQSHWFARLVTDLAERLLYPATLGASMIVAMTAFRWLQRTELRWAAIGGLIVSALLFSVDARRAWTDDLTLWSHGARVEPRAMRHQYNLSNELIRHGQLDDAAFHRLLAVYLVNRFPEPVEWEKAEALEALPVSERFIELPAALYPESPCPVIVAFLKQNEEVRSLHQHVVRPWMDRYPGCFVVSEPP